MNRDKRKSLKIIRFPQAQQSEVTAKPRQRPDITDSLTQEWEETASPYESGERAFYDETGFPEDTQLWHAYLTASQTYLMTTGLDRDYRYQLFSRNHLYPAKVLAKHGEDFLGGGDAEISTVLTAAMMWRCVRETPDLAYKDDIISPLALDTIYEIIDYYHNGRTYENSSTEAQAFIIATQICDIAEAASSMDNWALKLRENTLTKDDISAARALHQNVLMEKWIDPQDNQLMALLDHQMKRLYENLSDDRAILSSSAKKRHFRVVHSHPK